MLGAGLQSTQLGLRATLDGFPTPSHRHHHVGLLRGLPAGHFGRPTHAATDRTHRVFAALAAVASAIILVQAAFVQPFVWAVTRLMSGVCLAGIYVVAESWLNDRASQTNRGRLLAVYMLVLYVGLGAAQFLIILANPSTPTPFLLVSVLISLSMVPIAVSAQQVPQPAIPKKVSYAELYRNSPLGVVAVLGVGNDLRHHFFDGAGVRATERPGTTAALRLSWPSAFWRRYSPSIRSADCRIVQTAVP